MPSVQKPLTPTVVNNYIKKVLEGDIQLKKLYVEGEASNVKYHSNGTIYFNIKDSSAQINCLMFKNYHSGLDFKLLDGYKIEIIGNIYSYVKMGQVSINVFKLRKIGQGDLYAKYLELKNDLEKKGYFDNKLKKDIPKFPSKVAVITSDTGAAVRDVITTIRRRYPLCEISVIPTLVQGSKAYKDIVNSIKFANEYDFDLIILGRGGGSIEDLWAFNELDVAEAIFQSTIPIISAVGHETDFTIADFVADKRAPTPTAAAEMSTPDLKDLQESLLRNISILKNNMISNIKLSREKLDNINSNQYFQNPLLNINNDFMFLQDKFMNLVSNFEVSIKNHKDKVEQLNEAKLRNLNHLLNLKRQKLEHQKENLDNLNPLSILLKGYAVIKVQDKYVKSTDDVQVGDSLKITVSDGEILAKVLESNN